jgi:hypothetical protein
LLKSTRRSWHSSSEVADTGVSITYPVVSEGPELSGADATWFADLFLAVPAEDVEPRPGTKILKHPQASSEIISFVE